MTLHELSHIYYIADGEINYSTRLLGYFSSIELANHAISQYLQAPGYCDAPLAFTIRQRATIGHCELGKVYTALIYVHDREYEYFEHIIEMGLFSSEDDARCAISKFRTDNKVLYENTCFEIEEIVDIYEINKKYCEEGFVVFKSG